MRLSCALFLVVAATASAADFRVGFASADITPPIGWRRAGNYTELISTSVHHRLMAKATVLLDERLVAAALTLLNELKP